LLKVGGLPDMTSLPGVPPKPSLTTVKVVCAGLLSDSVLVTPPLITVRVPEL
jgi:hypothetical protein